MYCTLLYAATRVIPQMEHFINALDGGSGRGGDNGQVHNLTDTR